MHPMIHCGRHCVGRPRGFDEEKVLETVLEVFWQKGYEGTSVADLIKATGLHKGSLYQAFGDKKALFIRALRHYASNTFCDFQEIAAKDQSPMKSIRELIEQYIYNSHSEEGSCKGCMVVNTLAEMGPEDPQIKEILETGYRRRAVLLTELLTKAQTLGEIKDQRPAERLTVVLMTTMMGISIAMKGPVEQDHAQVIMEDLMASWV